MPLPRSRTARFVLLGVSLVALVAGIALGFRHRATEQLARAQAEFEDAFGADLGPMSRGQDSRTGMETLGRARSALTEGKAAVGEGRLADALAAVEELETLRTGFLAKAPVLVDVMLATAVGRMELGIAADVVTSPEASAEVCARLRDLLSPESDDLGVRAAVGREGARFLDDWSQAPTAGGIRNRVYEWFAGPLDRAATLRLYVALADAMERPILDVADHLRTQATPRTRVHTIVADTLIPNLRNVPIDHRAEATARRLVRLAALERQTALLGSGWAPAPGPADLPSRPDLVTDRPGVREVLADGGLRLEYPGAREILAQRPDPPAGASPPPPPPLRLDLPRPTAPAAVG